MELLEYRHVKDNAVTHRLLDAIIKLTNEKPIDSISITELANEAKINRATFYSYFQDKNSLIKYVYYHAVRDLDDMFERYDTFVKATDIIVKAFSTAGSFLPKAMESREDDSLASFVTYYWIRFNKNLFKEATGAEIVPDDVTMSIEMWIYGLVAEMRSVSKSNSKTKNENYRKLQLVHAPKEIRKILINNSLKAGIKLEEMELTAEDLT